MTLEEAIKHCEQKACGNDECSKEHKQLAEWLKELQALKTNNINYKEIEERAKKYATRKADISLSNIYNEALANIYEEAYIAGATEQKAIDIDNACIILCRYACPYKIDSNKCLNAKCDNWEMFRRMMEESTN